ncbi:FIG015373: Membrane protein [Pseudoalteromonas luteoviolacea B = ATCC 29581]|nr:FIG015373: Membrane protein [Pseudoalteromonas luteoviolacea B = ATCC 29581]
MTTLNLLPLIGVIIIVIGFALRFNPLLVVTVAGIATGFAVELDWHTLLTTFGEKFMNSRQLASFLLILPIIALLERYGLQERAKQWIASIKSATTTRILIMYFVVRECSAALGLLSLAGQAQTVRPLLAPMALGAATNEHGELPRWLKDKISAHAAACENIALFFGEDIFIAFGAVLLMDAFLKENGIAGIEPLHIGLWAIPTAIAALIVHCFRLARLEAEITHDIETHHLNQVSQEVAS